VPSSHHSDRQGRWRRGGEGRRQLESTCSRPTMLSKLSVVSAVTYESVLNMGNCAWTCTIRSGVRALLEGCRGGSVSRAGTYDDHPPKET
jgi:hypothetical protein